MKRNCSLLIVTGILLLGILASFWASRSDGPATSKLLAERMPMEFDGWSGVDIPLGDTESLRAAVGRLNYDDYIYRKYSKGAESIYVYAMYWRQGRISVREMAGHTPDGCWVANGATSLEAPAHAALTVDGRRTAEGEVRVFQFPGTADPVHVIWWHLWGGEIVPESFKGKSVSVVFHEIWMWLWQRKGQSADQVFVRVHSFGPISSVADSQVVKKFVELFPAIRDVSRKSADH